jgi:hypothetical protein
MLNCMKATFLIVPDVREHSVEGPLHCVACGMVNVELVTQRM